jgi:hypothetical protein
MKKARIAVFVLIFLSFVLSASAGWPGWFKKAPGGGTDGDGQGDPGTYSVAEPAAILLLGAGLVSLGIYAKRKRGKKQ